MKRVTNSARQSKTVKLQSPSQQTKNKQKQQQQKKANPSVSV